MTRAVASSSRGALRLGAAANRLEGAGPYISPTPKIWMEDLGLGGFRFPSLEILGVVCGRGQVQVLLALLLICLLEFPFRSGERLFLSAEAEQSVSGRRAEATRLTRIASSSPSSGVSVIIHFAFRRRPPSRPSPCG